MNRSKRRLSFLTPELSNGWSSPAKLGDYLKEISSNRFGLSSRPTTRCLPDDRGPFSKVSIQRGLEGSAVSEEERHGHSFIF